MKYEQGRSIKSIFKEHKVFIKEDPKETTTPVAYFYTTRRFLGTISAFTSKEERAFEDRHLKAYLKGQKTFKYHNHWYPVQSSINVKPLETKDVLDYNHTYQEHQRRQLYKYYRVTPVVESQTPEVHTSTTLTTGTNES